MSGRTRRWWLLVAMLGSASVRADDVPRTLLLGATTAADVARVAAGCRKTVVVSLFGDEQRVQQALKSVWR